MSSKIPKEAVLYIHKNNTDYECKDCLFWKDGFCALYDPYTPIKSYGACGFWLKRKEQVELPFFDVITKKESGYVENKEGFTCARCDEFIWDNDCQKVDKDSAGDDPGKIHKNGCCNRWSKK